MRLIDADAPKDYMRQGLEDTRKLFKDNGTLAEIVTNGFCEDIDEQPTIEPERKKGRWMHDKGLKQFFCDQCGEPSLTDDDRYIYSMDFPNFCPNCGSYNKGEQE